MSASLFLFFSSDTWLLISFALSVGISVILLVFKNRTKTSYPLLPLSSSRELILEGTIDALSREKRELRSKHQEVKGRIQEISRVNDYILKSIDYAVVTTDLQHKIKSATALFTHYFQISRSEVYGLPIDHLFQKQPDLLKRLKSLGIEESTFSLQTQIAHRSSPMIGQWFEVSATRLKDNYNNEIGNVILMRDITKLKQMEAQLGLKHELELLGEMSATLAHEFRNGLNPIKGNARLLTRLIQDPAVLEVVEDINQAVSQLTQVMESLLGYAKAQPLHLQEVDLQDILDDACLVAKELLSAKNIFVSINKEPHTFLFKGDPVMLQQAFSNLLINAIEAVEPETGKIEIQLSRQGQTSTGLRYHLLFIDNGSGIPEDIRDRIFRPFFTTKAQGTGLGLAFTHKIIIAHGGNIRVTCPSSGGSHFIVELPL
jgi:signal transduction histidine kinase